MLNPHIFRAYDVRGRVGADINPDVFRQVGRAYATLIRRSGGRTDRRRPGQPPVVGRAQGGASSRACAPPASTSSTSARSPRRCCTSPPPTGGSTAAPTSPAATTRSTYNGVKMVHPGAAPLTEDEIQGLRTTIERGDFERGQGASRARDARATTTSGDRRRARCGPPAAQGRGRRRQRRGRAASRPSCCAASAARSSSSTASRTGASPTTCPIPRIAENVVDLQAKVLELGADLGIAYDGDADRVGVIDERGRRHEADLILALLARDLLTRHPGRQDRLRREVARRRWSTTSGSTAACPSCGRPATRTSSARCATTTSCSAARSAGTCSSPRTTTASTTASSPPASSSSSSRARAAAPCRALFDSLPHLLATPELKAPCPDDEKFARRSTSSRAS